VNPVKASQVVVSPATVGDIPSLVELMREFYAESSHALDAAWAAGSFQRLLAEPAWGGVWLARHGEVVAGHVVLVVRYGMEHGALAAHIDDLFVRPQFRRRGVACALLSEVLDECRRRGCQSLHVEVDGGNRAAVALYGRFGLGAFQDGRVTLHSLLTPG
jgi:ribosomal protein S18 acetylase RimI-like enzyme